MLYRRKFANLVIAVILLTSSFGISETSTLYTREGDDNSSFTIDLKANQVDYNTSFKYPATEVLEASLVISGNGDVIEPDDGLIGIGSGGMYALAAARALIETKISPRKIAEKSMKIAADICIYTNDKITFEELEY